jgi:hypothetical protein
MNKLTTRIGALAALLMLSISAFAQAQSAAPVKGNTYAVRGVFYTVPVKRDKRGVVTVTDPSGRKTFPPITDISSPLDGGTMGTKLFAEGLKKLEAAGKVTIQSRPMGAVRSGETLQLWGGASYVPLGNDIDYSKLGDARIVSPLSASRFDIHVEEVGDNGEATSLTINTETNEAMKDGTVYRASLQTTVRLRAGETIVYVLGTSPDNKRETFFAISAELVTFK